MFLGLVYFCQALLTMTHIPQNKKRNNTVFFGPVTGRKDVFLTIRVSLFKNILI